jgi:seryl-tRNA synthetase
MYDIKWIRENAEAFDQGLVSRQIPRDTPNTFSDALFGLDDARKAAIAANQAAQERRNALSKEIGQAMGRKDMAAAEALKAEVARLKEAGPDLENAERAASEALHNALAAIPNMPQADVPVGGDEHGNVIRSVHGNRPEMAFSPKEHWELGEALGMMDFETAAKLSGARFVVLKGPLARLERALGQFFLDTHTTTHGYTEVNPPLLVRDEVINGVTSLAKFNDDLFRAGASHWLIPTSEAPLTNLVRESILAEAELPIRVTALTPCFRAEAGSAGRDTKGMLRQHQFNKVELVSITKPEDSNAEHERMLASAEAVLRALGLHYRVMTLCTGDMGFASTKTFDIEVWLPGQDTYREISSCSNCGDFQARRMNARVRGADGKSLAHVHTLNGSGVAVGRALIAVMENYQNADGSITVPEALRPYMGGVTQIARA